MIFSLLLLSLSLFFPSMVFGISEKNYQAEYQAEIIPFLQRVEDPFTFASADGKYQLSGVKFIHPHPKGVILFLEGRTESWSYYGELFYGFYQQGYSIYSYDYRGQGLSPHLVEANPKLGHIEHFSDYRDDLQTFVTKVFLPEVSQKVPLFLMGHSLGGAIAADYLEQEDVIFNAAILVSPMFLMRTDPFPLWLAYYKVGLGKKTENARGKNHNPISIFEPEKGDGQTHSYLRWSQNEKLRDKNHQASWVGDPTNGWVQACLHGAACIRQQAKKIKIPTLVIAAGADRVVATESTRKITQAMPHGEFLKIPGASHALFMEKDEYRNPTLQAIYEFLKSFEAQ